jgi:hypothetical protein
VTFPSSAQRLGEAAVYRHYDEADGNLLYLE